MYDAFAGEVGGGFRACRGRGVGGRAREKLQRAFGVGAGGACDEQLMNALAREAEDAGETGFVAVSHEVGAAFAGEFVPQRGVGTG